MQEEVNLARLTAPPVPPWKSLGSIGLLLVLQLPFPRLLGSRHDPTSVGLGELYYWLATAAVLAYVVLVERRSPSSIGLRRPLVRDLGLGLGAAILMIAGMALIYQFAVPGARSPAAETNSIQIMQLPIWLKLLIIVRAATFEEVVYRGFAIERLGSMLGSRKLGALLSLTAFVLVHLYGWDTQHLIIVACGGIVLSALYLWRRNLWSTMLAHFVTDFVGLVVV